MRRKKTPKILIVDHDNETNEKLKSLLNEHFPKARITIVTNGDDAIEEYKTEKPDIIIMEILLEGRNGWQVAHFIRDYEAIWDFKEQEKSMIISITQLDQYLNEIAAAVYEIDLCFEKPLKTPKIKKLLKEMKSYLKSKKLL